MSTPGIRIRHKNSEPGDTVSYENVDIHELYNKVFNGEISVISLPLPIQSKLMIPLSLSKTEALVGNEIERAHKIQNIINSIYDSTSKSFKSDPSTKNEREKFTELTVTSPSKLPFISSFQNPVSPEEQSVKYRAELQASKEFWESELEHFDELRKNDFVKMQNRHKNEIKNTSFIPKVKAKTRPSSAFLALKSKETLLRNKKKFDDAEKLKDRAENVEFIVNKERIDREERLMKQRISALKEKQAFEKVTLEREWDAKLNRLKCEMNNEFNQKKTLIRSVTPKNNRMCQSLPASKISLPSLT